MPAEIINLRRARKAKRRAEAEGQAEANRAMFGRTKDEKLKARAEKERADIQLEGHRRDPERDR